MEYEQVLKEIKYIMEREKFMAELDVLFKKIQATEESRDAK